ncbi:hypothetical protein ABIA99_005258 [Bradyrhizobium sp. LB12.1]
MAHPQRLEIRFFGTAVSAQGVVGIIGAVALVALIVAMYIHN